MNTYEENGNKYLDIEAVAKAWDVTAGTVQKYCRDGKIKDAIKIGGKWYINVNATKPLKEYEIKRFIDLFTQLKNNDEFNIDLKDYGITQQAVEFVNNNISIRKLDYSPKPKKLNFKNMVELITKCAVAIQSVAQCYAILNTIGR